MRRNRLWFMMLIIGIVLATTICYITMRRHTGEEYAGGKIVQEEDQNESGETVVSIRWE